LQRLRYNITCVVAAIPPLRSKHRLRYHFNRLTSLMSRIYFFSLFLSL